MKRSSLLVVALLSCAHAASPRLAPTLRKKLHTLSGGVVHTDSFEELEPIPHEAAPTGPTIAVDDDVPTFQEKLIGELVGTFLLTLAVACVSAQDLPAPTVCGSFAVASILTGLIYGFGPLSRCHLQSRGVRRIDDTRSYGRYHGLCVRSSRNDWCDVSGPCGCVHHGKSIAPSIADPSSTLGWLRRASLEILFTGTIIQVVLHSGTTKAQEKNNVVGLAIGLTVFGCAVCSAVSKRLQSSHRNGSLDCQGGHKRRLLFRERGTLPLGPKCWCCTEHRSIHCRKAARALRLSRLALKVQQSHSLRTLIVSGVNRFGIPIRSLCTYDAMRGCRGGRGLWFCDRFCLPPSVARRRDWGRVKAPRRERGCGWLFRESPPACFPKTLSRKYGTHTQPYRAYVRSNRDRLRIPRAPSMLNATGKGN